MKTTPRESPIDAVTRIAANPFGPQHYAAATAMTILLSTLGASIYLRWPIATLVLLVSAAAFFGTAALAFEGVASKLLARIVPLQREAMRLRAELEVFERRVIDAEADRDRWKSAVEHAAGGPAGETPTDLIARQALRIRTLERMLGQEPSGSADGNGGDPS